MKKLMKPALVVIVMTSIAWATALGAVACSRTSSPKPSGSVAAPEPTQSPGEIVVAASPVARLTDPFQYCSIVGTVDRPGADWVGANAPIAITRALRLKFGSELVSSNGIYWRCEEGNVIACLEWGTNYCRQADESRVPTARLVEYCGSHRDDDRLSRPDIGTDSAWGWRCRDGSPEVVGRAVDSRGFNPLIWFEVPVETLKTPISTPKP
jgi:hypothetical protein